MTNGPDDKSIERMESAMRSMGWLKLSLAIIASAILTVIAWVMWW